MKKLILYLSNSSAVGFYALGFTHTLSPYLQTCWAESCFALILFCCGFLFLCLTFAPFSCRQERELGHRSVGSTHPSDLL